MMLESSFGKIRQIRQSGIADVKDNIETAAPPRELELTFDGENGAGPVLDRLCPEKLGEALRALTEELPQGITYRARTSAGRSESGTKHVHDFVIEKSESTTSLYFLDPEHYVGKQNLLRPSIANLMSMELSQQTGTLPKVAILRFRTQLLAASDRTALKMDEQLNIARGLVSNDALPEFLKNTPQEIVFRTVINEDKGIVQSRYVDNEWGLELFLKGASSAPSLEGRVVSQQAILQRFVRLLEEKKFEPIKIRE